MEEIIVEVKYIYGEKRVYPICKKAKLFAYIAGTKTLTPHVLDCIQNLDYLIVTVVGPEQTRITGVL